MIEIVVAKTGSQYLAALTRLFQSEWSEFEPYLPVVNGFGVPLPLLAFSHDKLIGGLAFTRFPAPKTGTQALWINALYVKIEHRNQRVSSKLIQHAERVAIMNDETVLYVYTHIPALYLNLGGEMANTNDEHTVLYKDLTQSLHNEC